MSPHPPLESRIAKNPTRLARLAAGAEATADRVLPPALTAPLPSEQTSVVTVIPSARSVQTIVQTVTVVSAASVLQTMVTTTSAAAGPMQTPSNDSGCLAVIILLLILLGFALFRRKRKTVQGMKVQ